VNRCLPIEVQLLPAAASDDATLVVRITDPIDQRVYADHGLWADGATGTTVTRSPDRPDVPTLVAYGTEDRILPIAATADRLPGLLADTSTGRLEHGVWVGTRSVAIRAAAS
jgi:pimeloyl-ACP methyl ester carboxylesterase